MKYLCPKCNIEVETSDCPVCGTRTINMTKVYWSTELNIPLVVSELCEVTENMVYISNDIRPVFPEERLLLELIWGEPLKYVNSSCWCVQGGTYIIDGKKKRVIVKKLRDLNDEMIRNQYHEYKKLNNYDSFNKYTNLFLEKNKKRFLDLYSEAVDYIKDVTKDYFVTDEPGKKVLIHYPSVFVSFSGGKDSTVVSDLVLRALGDQKITHIFGDTTLEFPETYDYVEKFRQQHRFTPTLNAKNREKNFYELCEVIGPPSRVMRWCCTVFKTGAIEWYTNKMFAKTNRTLTFYGIRRSESISRSKYEKEASSPKITKQKIVSPIIDWLDVDVWQYILEQKIDFNSAYRFGFARVGCWCCPNNSGWSEFLSKIHHPEEFYKFRDLLVKNAVKIGKPDPEEYVDSGAWKAKQGGEGIEYGKKQVVSFKPCATEENAFNYELQKPIDENLFELFKPFGTLNFDLGNRRLNEVYVFDRNNQVILKLQGKIGEYHLKVTIVNLPLARAKTIRDAERKVKCQLTKFQMCLNCTACKQICKFNAIKIKYEDEKLEYRIDEKKCVHCFECINHFNSGCYLKKVLKTKDNE